MKTNLMLMTLMTAGMAMAQVVIPDGTKIRVRLEQNLTSETAELGQTVDFAVTQEVRVGDAVVVPNGARATGSIVQAEAKRRLGRGGKLDFTIDRVQLIDGNWLNVRYTPQKNHGKGNGATMGVLTAGLAVVFWPAAPVALLMKGKEATIIKGRTYEVFSDDSVYVANAVAASSPLITRAMPQAYGTIIRQPNGTPVNNGGLPNAVNAPGNPVIVSNVSATNGAEPPQTAPLESARAGSAMVTINASQPGADIEIDGVFVGNAPTTIPLAAGPHKIAVRQGANSWERDIQITGGNVNLNAQLSRGLVQKASR